MTLYELKAKMATVGAQLQKVDNDLVEKLANPSVPIAEIKDLKAQKADLQERFDSLKDAHDKLAEQQKDDIKNQNPTAGVAAEQERLTSAKAAFIRAAVTRRPVPQDAIDVINAVTPLQAIPTSGNTGQNFLPTTMSNQLVHEPFTRNPMRDVIGMTSIAGLELPKIAFTLDDDSFISDGEAAKEIELTGDKVAFGKHKFKVKVRIADTVLHGSDVALVEYVENALRSGLAAKEKKVTFASGEGIVTGEEHMSFYQVDALSASVIKEVEGEDLYSAITGAVADLHEDFRENAKIIMRYADYVSMIRTLANGSATLYEAPPEKVLGKPVIFSDSAATPIVGDMAYMHLNYDPTIVYDADKDVDKGEYIWVLTAWIDQHKLLNSAFRLAKVVEPVPEV